MGFVAPLGLLGLGLLTPIIAMYLLKRRRDEVVVSSVFLWERVVQDIEANAPWQRLRRNLLLLLQLLFLLLAVFGLARPFVRSAGTAGQSLIFVLDSSASMGATDTEAGTRLDAARAEILRLMGGLEDGGTVTVIRAGDGASIVAANSDDRVAVEQTLAGIEPLARNSDLSPALTLAASVAARQPESEIVLLSDGAVQLPAALPLDRPLRYLPIGQSGENVAISALNLTATDTGFDLFARVTNYGSAPASRRLVIEVDGTLFTASDLAIPAGESVSRVLPLLAGTGEAVVARLEGDDALPADDVAWAVPGEAGRRQVRLLAPGGSNKFLTLPFQLLGADVTQRDVLSDTVAAEGDPADLLVLDRWLPETGLPGTTENLLIVAPPAGNAEIRAGGVITNPYPVRTGNLPAIEELLFFERGLYFVEARVTEVPPWGTVVLEDLATGTPLLWVGEQGGRRVALLATPLYGQPESIPLDPPRDVVLTNLVYQPVYPVLMATLAEYLLAGPAGGLAGRSLAPGEGVTLPVLDSARVEVTRPGGQRQTLEPAAGAGSVSLVPTEPGIYSVRWPDSEQPPIRFAVNLFETGESAIAPVPELQLRTQGAGSAAESGLAGEGRQELWRPLLLGALLLLAIEWAVYQRGAWPRLRGALGR